LEGYYDRNDTISVYLNESNVLSPFNSPGYLPLPLSDHDGSCNDNNYAQFARGASTICLRSLGDGSLASFQNQCVDGMVSTQLLIDNFLIASTPLVALLLLSPPPLFISSLTPFPLIP
jgi:hypothetical protein